MPDMNNRLNSQRRSLFHELPYFGQNITLAHGQFNNCLSCHLPSKKYLETLCSIYDLDLFSLNTGEAHNPDFNLIGVSETKINSLKYVKKSKVVSSLKHLNDNSTTKDPLKISNIFNRYFTSVGHNLATQVPSFHLITILVLSSSMQSRQMISNVRFCLFLKTKLMVSTLVRLVSYPVLSILYLVLSQTYLIFLCRKVSFHPN